MSVEQYDLFKPVPTDLNSGRVNFSHCIFFSSRLPIREHMQNVTQLRIGFPIDLINLFVNGYGLSIWISYVHLLNDLLTGFLHGFVHVHSHSGKQRRTVSCAFLSNTNFGQVRLLISGTCSRSDPLSSAYIHGRPSLLFHLLEPQS